LEQLLAEQLVEDHFIRITDAVWQMIDQGECRIQARFRRQKIIPQLVGLREMPATSEEQILKLNVWQRTPSAVTLACRQFRQQIAHVRERLQKDRDLCDRRHGE